MILVVFAFVCVYGLGCSVRLASFSAADPFTHCHGVRGFLAFASSGFALASLAAAPFLGQGLMMLRLLRALRLVHSYHLMHDLRAMGETNALADRLKHPTRRSLFQQAERVYRDRFATPEGKLPASFEIVSLTAWCPDDSQPKPLRPGSASTRLAEALGAKETRLPD